jgi:hypothetical protein
MGKFTRKRIYRRGGTHKDNTSASVKNKSKYETLKEFINISDKNLLIQNAILEKDITILKKDITILNDTIEKYKNLTDQYNNNNNLLAETNEKLNDENKELYKNNSDIRKKYVLSLDQLEACNQKMQPNITRRSPSKSKVVGQSNNRPNNLRNNRRNNRQSNIPQPDIQLNIQKIQSSRPI